MFLPNYHYVSLYLLTLNSKDTKSRVTVTVRLIESNKSMNVLSSISVERFDGGSLLGGSPIINFLLCFMWYDMYIIQDGKKKVIRLKSNT